MSKAREGACGDFTKSSVQLTPLEEDDLHFGLRACSPFCLLVTVVGFHFPERSTDVVSGSKGGGSIFKASHFSTIGFIPRDAPNCKPPSPKNAHTGSVESPWGKKSTDLQDSAGVSLFERKYFHNVYWSRTFSFDYLPFVSCPLAFFIGELYLWFETVLSVLMIFLVGNVFFICFLLLPLILYIFCDTQKSWIFFFVLFLWNELEKPPLSHHKLSVYFFIVMNLSIPGPVSYCFHFSASL